MKRLLLLSAVIVLVSGIAFFQNRRLAELRDDHAELKRRSQAESFVGTAAAVEKTSVAGVSEEQVTEVHEWMVDLIVAFRAAKEAGRRDANPEAQARMKDILLIAKDFSAENVGALIEALRADARLGEMTFEERLEACFELFMDVAPKAFLDYLEAHRDLPDWQQRFDRCYRAWLAASPQEAIERFEEEKGSTDYATTSARQSAMLALAASDPDRMLEMAMSPEFAADPDALAHLGGFVDDRLETPADHLRFMAALRRAEAKDPDSALLKTVRRDYVREMTGQVEQWRVEDVRTLVDGEFTPEERFQVMDRASHRGDLDEWKNWGDWFLKVDPKEWDQWVARQTKNFPRHPAVGLLCNWARHDPDSAAKWLEAMPASELRSAAVLEYAWTIADRDPVAAEAYVDELPDSKGKRRLLKKIKEADEK
jgi:hypothetical protein